MGNQNTSRIEKISDQVLIRLTNKSRSMLKENTGWPEPTTAKKSDAPEVGSPQGRYDLDSVDTAFHSSCE
jgi:hypothetical protein